MFSFMSGPTGEAMSRDDLMETVATQPFGIGTTLWNTLSGGAEESYVLGTEAKRLGIDEGRHNKTLLSLPGIEFRLPSLFPNSMETDADVRARGDEPLTQEQYKASPFYRERVPWDERMTKRRAEGLAAYDDRKTIREEMARRRPFTGFVGTLAGSALDPINYVPVIGEGALLMGGTRATGIAGRALMSGADAAANVGIAGLLTAPERSRYGDDTSWQTLVSDIAMSAAIGGAFGAIGGAFHARREGRMEAIRRDTEARLATYREGQDSIATLGDAIASLADDGEVRLGEASLDRMDALQQRAAETATDVETLHARALETPAEFADRILRESMPDDMRRLSEIDTAIQTNTDRLTELRTESMDNERFGSTRAALIEAKQLDERFQRLEAAAEKASSAKERGQIEARIADVQAKVQAIFDRLDPAIVDRIDYLDEAISRRQEALTTAKRQRAPVASKVDAARQEAIARFMAEPTPARAMEPQAPAPRTTIATEPARATTPREAVKAEARVAKTETPKDIAQAHGVDPESGSFLEEFEFNQMDKEGKITAADHSIMKAVNDDITRAKAWGEALRSAAACLL